MAIAFVDAEDATTTAAPGRSNNGDLTVTFPQGYTPITGQFALFPVYLDQGDASTPTNWTEVTGSPFGTGTEKLCVFYRVLVAGDSAPVTTISGSGVNLVASAGMVVYGGVDTTTPIDGVGSGNQGTGTPMTATGFDPTTDNAVVLHICGRGDNETAGNQSFGGSTTGVTERLDAGTNAGNDGQVSIADKLIATGASGDASSDTSATDPWVSVIIALRPAPPSKGWGPLFAFNRNRLVKG